MEPRVTVLRALLRGLARRCPRCGRGPLYERWNQLWPSCTVCGLPFETRSGDTWFFTYVTTAGLTGVLIVTMILLQPPSVFVGQLVLLPVAIGLMLGSVPFRKGVAIAIDYLVDRSVQGGSEPAPTGSSRDATGSEPPSGAQPR